MESIISEGNRIFFFRVLQILFIFRKWRERFRKIVLILRSEHLNWLRQTLAFTETEYLASVVHILRNSLRSRDTTKTEILGLIYFKSDKKIWQKYSRADLSSLLDPLKCSLLISFLTWGFFSIWVTLVIEVYNFRNK